MSLLIIDPNSNFRRMLGLALEATGYIAHVAGSGDEALDYLHNTRHLPDVILSEFALPGWDDAEFLDTLRQHPQWEAIPVIIMTTHDQPRDRKTAIQHGANAYLVKPFTFEELGSILERWGLLPFDGHQTSPAFS